MNIDINSIKNLAINSDITTLSDVADIKQMGDTIHISLQFYHQEIAEQIENLVQSRFVGIKVDVETKIETKKAQPNVTPFKNIKNIIAIASGKGGVGKSSTAINLALALSDMGANVGLLDADIYGPSQPTMLGVNQRPKIVDKTMFPVIAHGLQTMSIGYLVEPDSAMVWRAPMIVGALQQLINDTQWDNLDYLVIDLPPGTGDIQLTLSQKIPVTGAVTVTTPQDISLIDAKRAINMFEKVGIDNIGIIENMSTYICKNCGHESPIFGKDGGKSMANEFKIDYLGDIPLDIQIRESLDKGQPITIADSDHKISQRYHDIATKIAITLAKKEKSYNQAFGKIQIEGL